VTIPDDEWRALAPETRRVALRNARRLRAHPDPVVSAIAARHARRYLDARTWQARTQWLAIGLFLADVLVAGIVLGWLSGGPAASRPGALERSLIWLAAVLIGVAIVAPYAGRKVRIIRLYRLELANKLTLGSVALAGAAPWPAAGGPALTAGRELSVRYDKRRVLRQCSWMLAIAGCMVVILVGQGLSAGITPEFCAVAGFFAVFGLLLVVPQVALLARWVLPGRPIVEVDAAGVHMPSIACDLPWDQLAEVRLLPLRYARRGGQGAMVIAFVPRDPPAVLAAIAGSRGRQRLARSLRVYGTPLSISDGLIDHSAEQVAAAAAAFAALPVRRY
jgi:hypothetical protein